MTFNVYGVEIEFINAAFPVNKFIAINKMFDILNSLPDDVRGFNPKTGKLNSMRNFLVRNGYSKIQVNLDEFKFV